jgi:hypothetical protein
VKSKSIGCRDNNRRKKVTDFLNERQQGEKEESLKKKEA